MDKDIVWIDTNNCPQSFHGWQRDENGQWRCVHPDDTDCELTEWDFASMIGE